MNYYHTPLNYYIKFCCRLDIDIWSLYSHRKCMCEHLSEIRLCYETPSATRTIQEEENARGDASLYFNIIAVLVLVFARLIVK